MSTEETITWTVADNNLSISTNMGTETFNFERIYSDYVVFKSNMGMTEITSLEEIEDIDAVIAPQLTSAVFNNKKLTFGNAGISYEYLLLENNVVYFKQVSVVKGTWTISENNITISFPDNIPSTDITLSIELLDYDEGKLKDTMGSIIEFELENIDYDDIEDLFISNI